MDSVMNFLMGILMWFYGLDHTVFVTMVIFILALCFRVKFGTALKGALLFGAGLAGIFAINNLLTATLSPLVTGLSLAGFANDTLDGGMSATFGAITSLPFFVLIYPVGLLTNLLLLKVKWTKTMIVDFLNYFAFLIPALPVYFLTKSVVATYAVVVVCVALTLKVADWTAPMVQEYYGVEDISVSHSNYGFQAIYVIPLNWLLDKIPGLNKIDFNMDDVKKKLGIFGEPSVIGLILGTILGLIAGLGVAGSLAIGMTLVAAMLLFSKVVSLMIEGLQPISKGMKEFMAKKSGRTDLYMGMDAAIFYGDPSVLTVSTIMMPIFILLHFILPGVRVIPGAETLVSYAMACTMILPFAGSKGKKGNIFRSILIATIQAAIGLYALTYVAPLVTEIFKSTGVAFPGDSVTAFAFREPQTVITYFISKLCGLTF